MWILTATDPDEEHVPIILWSERHWTAACDWIFAGSSCVHWSCYEAMPVK